MAYDSATLSLVSNGPLTGAGQTWRHSSADVTGNVDAAGFITGQTLRVSGGYTMM